MHTYDDAHLNGTAISPDEKQHKLREVMFLPQSYQMKKDAFY